MRPPLFMSFFVLFLFFHTIAFAQTHTYDIVIYGGSSAGVSAAIQAARAEKSVVIVEPYERLGGLTTGGLGATDIGNKDVIGGISREFYQNLKAYYEQSHHWKWEDRAEYMEKNQRRTVEGDDGMWTFEPSAAMSVYQKMMAPYDIDIFYGKKLNRTSGVILQNGKILSIETEEGERFAGKMFLDCTYEGDLMAAAGVTYTTGRESTDRYGEKHNGYSLAEYHKTSGYHQFPDHVDPYREPGNPRSGLLWGISTRPPAEKGDGDELMQAYNFRICLTDHPDNRIPISKPDNYDPQRYELLVRLFEAQPEMRDINQYFIWTKMPNRKTDVNNRGGFSTDAIGMNHDWPEASYEVREAIWKEHLDYTQGLLYFYQNDERVPEILRNEVRRWGYPADEYEQHGHFTPQLYVREGRRMVSDYVMTEHHCLGQEVANDVIGYAAYGMDSHNTQRIVVDGMVKNEGNVEIWGFDPYPISYRSIVPRIGECENLLVPVSLSASHIAFGSIRMEPVFMVLGQSAAAAAVIAIERGETVQEVNYEELRQFLINAKQIIER